MALIRPLLNHRRLDTSAVVEIVREELPIAKRFNESAYKRHINLAKISKVLEKEAILKNLNCVEF